jgi:hypothetical protein
VSLFFVVILGNILNPLGPLSIVLFSAFLLYGIADYLRLEQSKPKKIDLGNILFIAGSVGLNLAFFSYILAYGWDAGYLNMFFDEYLWQGKVMFGDRKVLNRDTLSHIAYTTMLANYNATSTGIHGLTPFNYHLGSHLFMASLSKLMAVKPSLLYNFAFLACIYPAFLQTIYTVIVRLSAARGKLLKFVAASIIVLFIIQLLPIRTLNLVGHFTEAYFVSESHVFGIWMMFIYIGALFLNKDITLTQKSARYKALGNLLLLPLFLGWICFTKVTLGLACGLIFAVYFCNLFLDDYRTSPYLLALLSVFACFYNAYANKTAKTAEYINNYFISRYGGGLVTNFYLGYYYYLWIMLAVALLYVVVLKKINRLYRVSGAQPERFHLIFVLITLLVTVVCHQAIHFSITDGSGGYFTNISMWLSLLSLGVLSITLVRVVKKINLFYLGKISGFLAIFCIGFGFYYTRQNLLDTFEVWRSFSRGMVKNRADIDDKSEATANYQKYMDKLARVDGLYPKDTLIYLDHNESKFWDRFSGPWEKCQVAPLMLVGVSGRPMIFGVNAYEDRCTGLEEHRLWLGEGYPRIPVKNLSPAVICKQVRAFNMRSYLSLNWNEQQKTVEFTLNNCFQILAGK